MAICGCVFRPFTNLFLVRLTDLFMRLIASSRNPKKALQYLLEVEKRLYVLTGRAASEYEGGRHVRHRLTKYHDFFCSHIKPEQTVLDIGCGIGALAKSIAERTGAKVTGIEIMEANYERACRENAHSGVQYIKGDATIDLPDTGFDVVVMSNVLEHIENRVDFIRKIRDQVQPDTWLIRVPLYEREWRVPLMDEVGVDSRLDPTHYTEYTEGAFKDEMQQAGLIIAEIYVKWGEIWAVVKK